MVSTTNLIKLLNDIHRYEPGIYDKIARLCGVYKEQNFQKGWRPWFENMVSKRIDVKTFIRADYDAKIKMCEEVALDKSSSLYNLVSFISRLKYNECLGDNLVRSNMLLNSFYKHLGFFRNNLRDIQNIGKCSIMFHNFTKKDDIKNSKDAGKYIEWQWDSHFVDYCVAIHVPTHFIEIIPENGKSIIFKGYFVDMMIRDLGLHSVCSQYMHTDEYVKDVNRYYDRLTGDL